MIWHQVSVFGELQGWMSNSCMCPTFAPSSFAVLASSV